MLGIYPNYPVLAQRLRNLRLKKHLSQKELGRRSGVGRMVIFCLEHQRFCGYMQYDIFCRLAAHLDTSATYLAGLSEEA